MPDISALAAADEVQVIEGAGFDAKKRSNNVRLAVEGEREAIEEIAALLLDWTGHEPMDWMEWPAISVVFLSNRGIVAEFGLLGGAKWVRTSARGDREVAHPDAVRAWLAQRGV